MTLKRRLLHVMCVAAAASLTSCLAPTGPGANVKAASDVGEGPEFQVEKMARMGGNTLATPFQGAMLYGNGDYVEVEYNFASPGRYAFDIRGASSDGTLAGITVFVEEVGGTTVFFESKEGENKVAMADVAEAGKQKVRLQLTTDVGQNDTYLDSFVISRRSDLLPPPSPPAKGAFETGVYRNMFVERGYDPEIVQKRVEGAYELLFHGDINEQSILFPAGSNENGPLAFVPDIGSGDIRSEGMSYGMMIAVQMDKQQDFNAIWNWAKTYMYKDNPKHPCYGYFSWSMNHDGTARDEMPAPDGEEYFIMSLFFASNRWGDGEGIYNYKKEALDLLDKFKNRPEITGTSKNMEGTRDITGVALMNTEKKMVRFTPDKTNFAINGDHTNPSYHLPAFYELWALWGPEQDKAFWQEAAKVSREFFHKATHPKTGLAPDYANFDGTPLSASFNKGSDTFRWDAWRVAMNWGFDYHWFAKDEGQKELSNRIQTFFESHGMYAYRGCWTLSGRPAEGDNGKWHSTGVVATNAIASLAATEDRGWKFVDGLWGTAVPTGTYRYYDGMLLMFGLLHLSGNYKIYMPGHHEKAAAETPTPEAATEAAPAAAEGEAEKPEAAKPAAETEPDA